MTYKQIYEVSKNKKLNISQRQNKLEGLFNSIILEVRNKPPQNKFDSDRYWHRAIEISREICRIEKAPNEHIVISPHSPAHFDNLSLNHDVN